MMLLSPLLGYAQQEDDNSFGGWHFVEIAHKFGNSNVTGMLSFEIRRTPVRMAKSSTGFRFQGARQNSRKCRWLVCNSRFPMQSVRPRHTRNKIIASSAHSRKVTFPDGHRRVHRIHPLCILQKSICPIGFSSHRYEKARMASSGELHLIQVDSPLQSEP